MKRFLDKEDDDWGTYDQDKKWEHEKEDEVEVEVEEEVEEEEEEEELEPPFPPHPSTYGAFTWESIAESLNQGTLPSTLYKELPPHVYFTFNVCILEGHRRYLKNKVHLTPTEIDESDETLESFITLDDLIEYCFNNDYN
jgi:hypothetical protein